MSISVVVPTFNHGALLRRAVGALMRQNPAPQEIIIIDDGSTDNSPDVIRLLQASLPCIHAIEHKENKGVVMAMLFSSTLLSSDCALFQDISSVLIKS